MIFGIIYGRMKSMKTVTNEEFLTALDNVEYARIISAASKRLSRGMTKQEIKTCRMDALWRSMANHDPEKSKFETYLYNYTRWIFLYQRSQKAALPGIPKEIPIATLGYDIVKDETEDRTSNINFNHMLEKLSAEDSQLIREYYLENYSLSEIAKKRECSRQWIHQRMQKIIKTLRKDAGLT